MSLNFNDSLNSFCRLDGAGSSVAGSTPSGSSADVYLYGAIGGSKVSADKLQTALSKIGEVDVLYVYLNTYGGTFSDGLAIYNILKSHPAFVVVRVMGYSLSMGSVIMLAADRVECVENGLVMIHRAQGLTIGCIDEHHKTIELLLKHEQTMKPVYLARMGIDEAGLDELLSAETWYTADEAQAAGLVDEVVNRIDIDDSAANAGASGFSITHSFHDQRRLPAQFRRRAA